MRGHRCSSSSRGWLGRLSWQLADQLLQRRWMDRLPRCLLRCSLRALLECCFCRRDGSYFLLLRRDSATQLDHAAWRSSCSCSSCSSALIRRVRGADRRSGRPVDGRCAHRERREDGSGNKPRCAGDGGGGSCCEQQKETEKVEPEELAAALQKAKQKERRTAIRLCCACVCVQRRGE